MNKSTTPNKNSEFANFDRTMQKLINIPHSEIKAKLDAEKAEKKKKRKPKTSASGRGYRVKD